MLVAAAALLCAVAPSRAADKQPNILVIWGDDIGIYNISAYNLGLMGYKTPNICRARPKWSGTELKKDACSSVNAGKAIGERIKTGGEDVKKWSQDIGDGIKGVERTSEPSFDEQPSWPKS